MLRLAAGARLLKSSATTTVNTCRIIRPNVKTTELNSLTSQLRSLRLYSTGGKKEGSEEIVTHSGYVSGFSTQGNVTGKAGASAFPSQQFKTYKPTTPGKRWLKRVPRDHLYKGKAVRRLTVAKRSTGGRNNTGRITIRHRGGGHKRRIRLIDWYRMESGQQQVMRLEHDPGRSAWIALLRHEETGNLSYIVAPHGVKPGDKVTSYRQVDESSLDVDEDNEGITRTVAIDVGNCMPLKMMPVGTIIHNVGLKRGGPGVMVRAAGAYAQLIHTGESGYAQVRLSSGEVRLVPVDACATIGAVSNPDHQHESLGKAGRSRWMGIRPTVRGMAMNAVDHPHGGGRGKSKGNKDPRSPWGVLAKGGKTRKTPNQFVVKPRPRR
ncbi:rml2p [Lichtheimia corymbifera JMRC:FSU:9682]|uniref:Large ribosomal subunit protein uL2m n=1 Tax=Lichtheimia corymbifera JMRC:FSU:9682 TaxID=1263082 RepID=A0A068RPV6_9FUNG|nr:rml2p [Lichtheimia corymbifera JMRC:FSU:9682]